MTDTPTTPSRIDVKRIAGHIGAEISGVDLTQPLPAEAVEQIKGALLAHKVVFFRQQRLNHAQHVAFAREFGEPTRADPHDEPTDPQFPEILTIDQRPDEDRYGTDYEERFRRRRHSYLSSWHIDNSAAVNPPAASILRAEVVPEVGGDTQWTNLVAAYEGLSAPLRTLADGLSAEHRFLAGFHMPPHDPEVSEVLNTINRNPIISIHPLVRVIPETGQRALFVSPSTMSHLVGLSTAESHRILDLFYEHAARDEYRVRFRWEAGSIAFWDNRTTAHLAALDHAHLDTTRRLYRVSLLGDRPVGPDGTASRSISGPPFAVSQR